MRFGLGQSLFPVPNSVVAALQRHAAEKDYLPVQGLPRLRETVADFHARRDGVGKVWGGCDGGSGQQGTVVHFANGGGCGTLASESQLGFLCAASRSGGTDSSVAGHPIGGRVDSPARLLEHACLAGQGPRILLLNCPNPTGRSHDRQALEALATVCRAHQVLVVSDEIYGEVHHQGDHVSMAQLYPEGTIISAGLSKWCGAVDGVWVPFHSRRNWPSFAGPCAPLRVKVSPPYRPPFSTRPLPRLNPDRISKII